MKLWARRFISWLLVQYVKNYVVHPLFSVFHYKLRNKLHYLIWTWDNRNNKMWHGKNVLFRYSIYIAKKPYIVMHAKHEVPLTVPTYFRMVYSSLCIYIRIHHIVNSQTCKRVQVFVYTVDYCLLPSIEAIVFYYIILLLVLFYQFRKSVQMIHLNSHNMLCSIFNCIVSVLPMREAACLR